MRRINWKGILLLGGAFLVLAALAVFLGYILIFTGQGSI